MRPASSRYKFHNLGDFDMNMLTKLHDRVPPTNLQAEQALLGALLANNRAYEAVSELLTSSHFADPIHGGIYLAISRRIEAGQAADAVALKVEFGQSGLLDDVGGTAYLAQLSSTAVASNDVGAMARAIRDAWQRRRLIDIGEFMVTDAFSADSVLAGSASVGDALRLLESAMVEAATLPPSVL
jgi:replicative DNA helicase